jgi:hypothetical protein
MSKRIPKFKSKLETEFYHKHEKLIIGYETDRIGYTLAHTYTPDWKIADKVFIETKGRWLSQDRTKILNVLKQHLDITIIMAFQEPHKQLTSSSVTTYADWCDRKGIPWVDANDTAAVRKIIAEYSK